MHGLRFRLWASSLVLMVGMAGAQAQVSNTSGTASITIVPSLSITKDSDTNWGTVTLPTSGSTEYTLSTTTGLVTVTSGTGFSFGDSYYGQYTLNGGALAPVSFSVSIGAFSGSGVTVVSSYVNGTSDSGTGNLSALGAMTLKIGGVLSVASTADTGAQTATITVNADYT